MALLSSLSEPASITFFADASSRERDYMVAGGFAVAGERINEIEAHIAKLRASANIREFHWSEYRGGNRKAAHEALVEYAFDLIARHHAALHIIIAKFKDYRHKAKDGENRDTSINRMYYQLCLHRPARFYGKKRAIHIRFDNGNDSADICRMRNQLCADAYKKYRTLPNCVRSIEPVNSEKVGIIQMADVILGAVAAKRNGIQHANAKADLADFVLVRSGHTSWSDSTSERARFFTVWNHQGKGGPR